MAQSRETIQSGELSSGCFFVVPIETQKKHQRRREEFKEIAWEMLEETRMEFALFLFLFSSESGNTRSRIG